ncbi:MAG: helix-turn-helix domain-containing protein [Candidatus Sabulitectum sp.]|nr:helix-turn-helix domain-containing protein [Candidatus Sabulitectum sp.]
MKNGLKIKKLRVEKGMTQEKLAEKTNLTTRTIQRIENGEVDPRAYSLQMIASALNVDFLMFMEKDSGEDSDEKKADTNNWLVLIHLSGIFLLVLPSIILWHRKKDAIEGITKHFRAVISFQLSCWLGFILPGFLIYWKLGKPQFLIIGLIVSALISIHNAVNVFNNKPYQYGFRKNSSKKDQK